MGAVAVDACRRKYALRCGHRGVHVRSHDLTRDDALFSSLLVLCDGAFEVEIVDHVAAVCQCLVSMVASGCCW